MIIPTLAQIAAALAIGRALIDTGRWCKRHFENLVSHEVERALQRRRDAPEERQCS